MNYPPDEQLVRLLKVKPEAAMELIFKQYYSYLCSRIIRIVHEEHLAEDLAQDVFLDLWRKREKVGIRSSLKAYLGRAGVNRALNYLRDHQPHLFGPEDTVEMESAFSDAQEQLQVQDLQALIDAAIEALPDRCRLVFSLSRFEGMSNREVAEELDISEKTVENQMTKALRLLRQALNDYRK